MQHTDGALSWIQRSCTGTTKEFAGVNLLGDYEFSMTISADQLRTVMRWQMLPMDRNRLQQSLLDAT
ncbi:MAG: hypothetical protein ACLR2O_02465 [Coprococcus sp.]